MLYAFTPEGERASVGWQIMFGGEESGNGSGAEIRCTMSVLVRQMKMRCLRCGVHWSAFVVCT